MKKRLISSGVTIADVAEAAGVSVSLVSFVLNAKRGPDGEYMCSASRATAEKIVETATRLGYHKNMAASALRTGYSKTPGIHLQLLFRRYMQKYREPFFAGGLPFTLWQFRRQSGENVSDSPEIHFFRS